MIGRDGHDQTFLREMIAEMHGEGAGDDSSEDLGSEASTVLNTFKSKGIMQEKESDGQDKYMQN